MKKTVLFLLLVLAVSVLGISAAERIDEYQPPIIKERTSGPIWNSYWLANCMNLNIDQMVLGVDIIAYKIRWFNGNWSGWFVPGNGDEYQKPGEPQRRYWACFNDHTHKYIYILYPKYTPLKAIVAEATVDGNNAEVYDNQ